MMLDQAQSTLPADFAVINLDSGQEWLTSRLYIAAVMLERMRNVQVLVFLESTATTTRRFVAVVPISQLRWSLAQHSPWLEAAWTCAYLSIFPQGTISIPNGVTGLPDPRTLSMTPSPIESSSGALNPWQARQLVSQFITLLQQPATAPVLGQSQMRPSVALGSATLPIQERADWVTRQLLETLLPPQVFELWADAGRDAPRIRRTRSVLRRPAPFIALVQGADREYVRLANRAALLEEIAASLGDEPDSNRA